VAKRLGDLLFFWTQYANIAYKHCRGVIQPVKWPLHHWLIYT